MQHFTLNLMGQYTLKPSKAMAWGKHATNRHTSTNRHIVGLVSNIKKSFGNI